MIIPDIETRNEYLKGNLVFYLDHDIPIKDSKQFMKELEKRVEPGELTITQQIKDGYVKHADKWIHNGWRLFCYDDYETSFKYNLDFRFERLVDGHFRRWWIFMNEKSIQLFLDKSFEFKPEYTWGDFIEKDNANDKDFLQQLANIMAEIVNYIVPFFHSTKIIVATNKAEYQFLEDYLSFGESLDNSAGVFTKYFRLPLWITKFKFEEDLENETVFS